MQSYREVIVSLSLVSTSNWESSFLRSLHVLLQLICKGSKLSWPCMPHTHGHTQTHTHSFSPRHYVLWLANWLANILWLRQNLAGRNWKMGSPLFSPLGWTKDQSFFLYWSNSKRWSTRRPSGWITTMECTCWSPLEWQSCKHKRWWEGLNGDMSYLFVLGHIYMRGVREAEGIEMVCQDCCHCATKHSTACVPD